MSDLFQGFASITKTVQQTLNSNEMRKIADKMQGYVMNFTETEQKVREATNEDTMSDLFQGFASITKTVQQTLNSNEMRKIADKMYEIV